MKYTIVVLTTVTLITAFVLSGCDSASDKMERAEISVIESNRDLEIAKSEVNSDVKVFRIEAVNKLMANNRSIEVIKERVKNEADMDVRVRHEQKLADLEKSNRDLRREIDNYEVSGRENWDAFKDSFSSKMDDLEESLNGFFSVGSTTTSSRN